MLAPLALTVLLAGGRLLASPYAGDPSRSFSTAAQDAAGQNAADARLAPADDTPSTASQVPALRAALAFAATAQFDLAAATLETFAAEHPHAAESAWALRRAYVYWQALGRDAEAARAVHRYDTTHAAREPRAAAIFFWSRHEQHPRTRAQLQTYLARHADHGPPDLRIVAEAELAADLWRTSCPRAWHGLCVDYTWATDSGPCSPIGRAPLFTLRPRDPAQRREALRHAATAARLSRALDLTRVAPWRRPALRAALGQAALVTSDDATEALIALEFPRHLSFNVEEYKNTPEIPKWQKQYREQVRRRDDSIRRFHNYWDTYVARHKAADHHADALRATGSPAAMLLGMTRFALALGEAMDEQDFVTTDDLQSFAGQFVYCNPSDRTQPWLDIADALLESCAALVPTAGMHPDLSVCFTGFSRLHGAADPLPELFGPA